MILPRWYELAMAEIGTKEAPGYANNPIVQGYYRDAGSGKLPDSVPWCMAFVNAMLERSGRSGTGFLAARSALPWGQKLIKPIRGCIVVFKRGKLAWQGHVAFFDSFTPSGHLRVLGGNQSDQVCYAVYRKEAVLGFRWPSGEPMPTREVP